MTITKDPLFAAANRANVSVTLLPCPFCGIVPEIRTATIDGRDAPYAYHSWVERDCPVARVTAPIEQWNRRVDTDANAPSRIIVAINRAEKAEVEHDRMKMARGTLRGELSECIRPCWG